MLFRSPVLARQDLIRLMRTYCWQGLISEQLVPHVKRIVGVDISQASVDRYNTLAADKLSLPPDTMEAICAELKGEQGELEGTKFDLVVVSVSPPKLLHLALARSFCRSRSAARPSTTSS